MQTLLNSVADGRTDEDGLMDDFLAGTFASMSEFAQHLYQNLSGQKQ